MSWIKSGFSLKSNLLLKFTGRRHYAKDNNNKLRDMLLDKESILENVQKNAKRLLKYQTPQVANIVDRSESLNEIYLRIDQLTTKWAGKGRKPLIALSGSPGSGKTLLTALAVSKIAPVEVSSERPDDDVFHLKKQIDLSFFPVFVSFNDKTSLPRPAEDIACDLDLDQVWANRMLYWLLGKYGEDDYWDFLNEFIADKDVPSTRQIIFAY